MMDNGTAGIMFNWTLDPDLSGPTIAFFIALMFFLALPTNLFIICHALCHRKTCLKKSAVILLFSLALSNLFMTLFYMPYAIVASAAEEWIFGSSDFIRNIFCQMHGFVFEYSSTMTGHILVIISIDRFLFIVRSMDYHKIMTWKVTCVILLVIGVLILIWCCSPFFGLGFYDWSFTSGGCLPFILEHGLATTVAYFLYAVLLLLIIIVTTVWTFVFTHGFLRKRMKIRMEARDSDTEKHIYLEKVRNLVGMFGVLLLVNAVSWIPYFSTVFYSSVSDLDKIPIQLDVFLFLLSLSNNATNPLIQIFFRKDLHDSIVHIYSKVTGKLRCRMGQKKMANRTPSPRQNIDQADTASSIV